MLDHGQLKAILPQAYPFLLLDRVEHVHPGESLVAIKNITANEWPFSNIGTVPQMSHYPETLLIEAAAQAALVLYGVSGFNNNSNFILGKIEAVFQNAVDIGNQLSINVFASKMLRDFGYMDMNLHVEQQFKVGDVKIFYRVVNK